ncbi:MAG: fluoride efflux transporter CrcB [Gammaproteobacteria bacterium]|nr:fluoride efflux transporter CrcB [Gammaproteobacteria bacterium]
MIERLLLIGFGSGVGGILRYLVSTGAYKIFGRTFPYGTLCVNAIGSFLIGFLFVVLLERFNGIADQLRTLLIIGFLGGFTTFSAFSIETMNLLESADYYRGLLNIIISVVLCLGLTWIGMILGRQL